MKPGQFAFFHFGERIEDNAHVLMDVGFAPNRPGCQAPSQPLD